jgi:hypothetical protein
VIGLSVFGVLLASLLSSPLAAQSAEAGDWSKGLVGSWELTLGTPDGDVPMVVTVREEGSNLVVELARGGQGGRPITNVRRSGGALVATYSMQYQGMQLPATVRLQRDGEELETRWSFADGMYETSARGRRR